MFIEIYQNDKLKLINSENVNTVGFPEKNESEIFLKYVIPLSFTGGGSGFANFATQEDAVSFYNIVKRNFK